MIRLNEFWLREWIRTSLDSKTLLDRMTMIGLEVSEVKPVASKFAGVLVGKVIQYKKHKNINKLYIAKIDIGSEHTLNIVCSNNNLSYGLKVLVAVDGALLPGNIKIKSTRIHGELSEGILCSFSHLGIICNYKYITSLINDAPVGIDIRDYLKLNDNIIKINITSNRPDCFSIIGIARDISATSNIEFKNINFEPVNISTQETLPIHVDAIDACPRYLGRIIKFTKTNVLTPLWMKEKLSRCGICSKNIITDIANYVLLELGQPLFIFNKEEINGGIIVRMAKDYEKIILSTGKELTLSSDIPVISDYKKILTIAGISVLEDFCISNKLQNLFVECAFYNPYIISRCARRYNLHSEYSYRYEHGVDPELQHKAIEYVTRILLDICGGIAGPVIDITNKSNLPKRAYITLHRRKLDRLIGYHINDEQVDTILMLLGFKVIKNDNQWQIIAPSWRFDVSIEEDIIEEITRIYGYNNIPGELPYFDSYVDITYKETNLQLDRVKTMLIDKGYQEVITYSFVDPNLQELLYPKMKSLILSNPISNEFSVMRLSLWPGLIKTIIYNQNRQQSRIRIFECGLCFIPDVKSNFGVRQDLMMSGAIYGDRYNEHWDLLKNNVDFYDIKGDLESIFDLMGGSFKFKFKIQEIFALHPGKSAAIYLFDKLIGFVGVLHPRLKDRLNINNDIVLFELKWNEIPNRRVNKIQSISQFPLNRRDISIIVLESVSAGDILNECKKVKINQIVDINLFDVYRGDGIKSGYKSFTISLIIQCMTHTLGEIEISSIIDKYIEVLKNKFQAILRN